MVKGLLFQLDVNLQYLADFCIPEYETDLFCLNLNWPHTDKINRNV